MIDRAHDLPITRQAEALNISRGSVYYLPPPVSEADLAIMRRLDRLHLEFPFAGSRMLRGLLVAERCKIGRRHVKTLMRLEDGDVALDSRRTVTKRWRDNSALLSVFQNGQLIGAGSPSQAASSRLAVVLRADRHPVAAVLVKLTGYNRRPAKAQLNGRTAVRLKKIVVALG